MLLKRPEKSQGQDNQSGNMSGKKKSKPSYTKKLNGCKLNAGIKYISTPSDEIMADLPPVTNSTKIPELLVPCGSEEAVRAAVVSGADAVYCGGKMLNARMNAKNLSDEALRRAITYCRGAGVKVYVTLNTLVYDRELRGAAEYAKMLYEIGANALIVADAGLCLLLREYLPDLELHASTQLSAHNLAAAEKLAALGFSRLVLAREMNLGDIY